MEIAGNNEGAGFELETIALTKSFGGFRAVSNVNLQVRTGTIHGLIGPNGAGKTTCFNLLTKFLQPTSGAIRYRGEDITRLSPSQIAERGLVRSFQISAVFPDLTVLENVRLAAQRQRGRSFDFWRSETVLKDFEEGAQKLIAEVNLSDVMHAPAGSLPYGKKRALEIATTLAVNPGMLLLDEPTAGMSHDSVTDVVSLIQKIRQNRTILIVEHNLSVVEGLCDTISVLARGQVLAQGDYASVSKNPAVIEAYLGAPENDMFGMQQEAV